MSADGSIRHNLARKCNEYTAELVRRRPEQFGFWASLPLPDVAATLEEIPYALNTLHANGVILETNHHGVYLGDPSLDAVFDELNRTKTTVFIHPTSPCTRNDCTTDSGGPSHSRVNFLPQFPNPMIEFMFDTTRALVNLFMSGTIARCPHITFVIPHAGGAVPPVIQRFCGFATLTGSADVGVSLEIVKETFKRQFYFDLAGFPFPDQIHGILRAVGPEKLLYGSDYPFTPHFLVKSMAEWTTTGLEDIFIDEATRRAILVGNARKLLKMTDV